MKTNITLLFLVFIVSIYSYAQPNHEDRKKQIQSLKVGFITSELGLTSDEASKFWPIYNDYDDKQFKLRHDKMKTVMNKLNNGSLDKMSDKEASSILNQMESNERELSQLREKFNTSLKGILSPVKILKLRKAEVDFNKKLLEQYRNKGPRK